MGEVKILLKYACGQEDVVQLGDVSRGFGRRWRIESYSCKLGVFSFKNSEVAVMIGHYIIHFENIVVLILLLF